MKEISYKRIYKRYNKRMIIIRKYKKYITQATVILKYKNILSIEEYNIKDILKYSRIKQNSKKDIKESKISVKY